MSKNLSDIFCAANIAEYYNNAGNALTFIGEALFPSKKKMGLTLTTLSSQSRKPIALKMSAFDAMAPLRDRMYIKMSANEMPFFREQMPIKEIDRQEILKVMESNNTYTASIINTIYDDRTDMISGAKVSAERMRMQIVFTGGIDVISEGLQKTVDYGFDAATQKTDILGADQWSNHATSKPFEDLKAAKKAAGISGQSNAYMSHSTFDDLIASESIRTSMFTNGQGLLTDPIIKDFIKTNYGINIIIVGIDGNDKYLDENKVEKPYAPDGIVSIMPNGVIGTTWYGTTPEEADLMSRNDLKTQVQIVDTGVAITSLTDYGPPVQVSTVVSMVCLPTISNVEKMHILKVNA